MENNTTFNKMFINGKNSCFITLKDHKPNFSNHPKFCLPTKYKLGRLSKEILDKINLNLRNQTNDKFFRWKNNGFISWFKKSVKFVLKEILYYIRITVYQYL